MQRTWEFGEAAFKKLKENRLSAVPRNFEFWYTYCAGYNIEFNKAVNAVTKEKGVLNQGDLSKLYSKYLSTVSLTDKMEEASTSLSLEISKVIEQINQYRSRNTSYTDNLQEATQQLIQSEDTEDLAKLVGFLMKETQTIIDANDHLEAQINASQRQVDDLRGEFEAIRTQTLTDDLTSLANRRYFEQSLKSLINQASQTGVCFGLILTDIDHFKKFNDTFGHQTGDQVLRLVAVAIRQNAKGDDIAFRYGGEEFAVLLPRATLEQAQRVAEKARQSVMSKELVKRSTGENLGRITISSGVALFQDGDNVSSLVERADSCLYEAKRRGRNQVFTEAEYSQESVA